MITARANPLRISFFTVALGLSVVASCIAPAYGASPAEPLVVIGQGHLGNYSWRVAVGRSSSGKEERTPCVHLDEVYPSKHSRGSRPSYEGSDSESCGQLPLVGGGK